MKKSIILILGIFLLFSCWQDSKQVKEKMIYNNEESKGIKNTDDKKEKCTFNSISKSYGAEYLLYPLHFSKKWSDFYSVIRTNFRKKPEEAILLKNWEEIWHYSKIWDLQLDWNWFIVTIKKNNRWSIIENWIKVDYNYDYIDDLLYDLELWIKSFRAKKLNNELYVINWKESFVYNSVEDLKYNSSWKSYAFKARKGKKWILIKDWVEINKYDDIGKFKYSKDWKSFSFLARKNNKQILVKDWIESTEYEMIYNFKYDIDWYGLIILWRKDNKEVLFKNWKVINKNNIISKTYFYPWDAFKYNSFWDSFSYVEEKNWKMLLVKDWIEGEKYDYIGYMNYNPINNKISYIAKKNWKNIFVIEWVEVTKYKSILDTYSRDLEKPFLYNYNGSSLSLITKDNKWWFIVKDWIITNKYEKIIDLKYIPSTNNIIFIVKNKWKSFIIQENCK